MSSSDQEDDDRPIMAVDLDKTSMCNDREKVWADMGVSRVILRGERFGTSPPASPKVPADLSVPLALRTGGNPQRWITFFPARKAPDATCRRWKTSSLARQLALLDERSSRKRKDQCNQCAKSPGRAPRPSSEPFDSPERAAKSDAPRAEINPIPPGPTSTKKRNMIVRKGLALLLTAPFLAANRSQSFFVGASREGNDAADVDGTGGNATAGVGDGTCTRDPSSPADGDGSCLPSTAQEQPWDDDSGADAESSTSSSDDEEDWSEDEEDLSDNDEDLSDNDDDEREDDENEDDDNEDDESEDDGSANNVFDWHTAGINDMWSNLKCDEVFARGPRPVPTAAQFAETIRLYNSIVTDESLRLDASAEGIHVGLEVRQADEKGRGIFATSRIDRGTRWRDSYTRTAIFYDPDHYRKFILGLEVDMACDVLQWAYGEEGPRIAVDLDEATMCNDGGWEAEGGNVGCDEDDPAMDCERYMYAIRDIELGEEILCEYSQFSHPSSWKDMGLD